MLTHDKSSLGQRPGELKKSIKINKYCWSVLTPSDPFYLGNIFGMVTRHALQVSRSGQGYIDLYKSLEWPRKWETNFEDGPEPEAPRSL
jgi:hypothetical protein